MKIIKYFTKLNLKFYIPHLQFYYQTVFLKDKHNNICVQALNLNINKIIKFICRYLYISI
jgi:hypothetical protein